MGGGEEGGGEEALEEEDDEGKEAKAKNTKAISEQTTYVYSACPSYSYLLRQTDLHDIKYLHGRCLSSRTHVMHPRTPNSQAHESMCMYNHALNAEPHA